MMNAAHQINARPARVLVVDDEGANRYSVSKTLERVGHIVDEAPNGEEALKLILESSEGYDVILADIRMPGIDGIELLRQIKQEMPDAVVILMTGYASLGTAVEALRLGAHDYLLKPSSSHDIRESVSRGVERAYNIHRRQQLLESILQDLSELTNSDFENQRVEYDPEICRPPELVSPDPVHLKEPSTDGIRLGPLTVFTGRYQIAVGNTTINLTPTEFDLLLYLAAHQGRVVPCSELVREVRSYSVGEEEAREVIRPHVSNLRKKLKAAGQNTKLIVNVRGVGYRLSDSVGT